MEKTVYAVFVKYKNDQIFIRYKNYAESDEDAIFNTKEEAERCVSEYQKEDQDYHFTGNTYKIIEVTM